MDVLARRRRRTEKLIELVPVHDTYAEPYFVDGSVLLAKPDVAETEVINDHYRVLGNFRRLMESEIGVHYFNVIVHSFMFQVLEKYPLHKRISRRRKDPSPEAAAFALRGILSQRRHFIDIQAINVKPPTYVGSYREARAMIDFLDALMDLRNRLEDVKAVEQNPLRFIRENNHPRTFLYVEPPRLEGTGPPEKASTPTMTRQKHSELVRTLNESNASVMITGYPDRLYDETFSDWYRRPLGFQRCGAAAKLYQDEFVWWNF